MKTPILILVITFLFCLTAIGIVGALQRKAKDNASVEVKDDFLKVPEYKTTSDYTSQSTSSYGESYWFVVGLDAKCVMRNGFIKQNHQHFSYKEAKVALTNDCFITSFMRIDKETYDNNKEE